MARTFAFLLLLWIAWPADVAARFLSVDPIEAGGTEFNRYRYANDNPYRFVDPDGRQSMGPSGYGFYAQRPDFFRDNAFGRFVGHLVGDPIALARRDHFNPITNEVLGPGQRAEARLDAVLLAVPVARTSRGVAKIADDAFVVRGGANSAKDLSRSAARDAAGAVGFPVQSASGMSLCQLCSHLPVYSSQIGATTAGAIRAAGGDVVRMPGQSGTAATVTGLSPDAASQLLRPTRSNPSPRPGGAP